MTNATNQSGEPGINLTILLFAVIVGLCFCMFQIRGCASDNNPTEYVLAIQACDEFMKPPQVTVSMPEKKDEAVVVDMTISPEILATLKHCHETVERKFSITPDIPPAVSSPP